MAKASRPAVKTLTLNKSSDIVVERLLGPCEEDNHSRCTGWAVLRKEVSPIGVNYFLRCTCACHHHKKEPRQIKKKQIRQKLLKKRTAKKKAKKKLKPRRSKAKRSKKSKKSKRSKKARRR